ncbi:MAG: Mor transcription activator family protein [Aquisalimonadaceae bacterium]
MQWNPEDLPARIAEIAEVVGMSAALELVQGWGGLRVYVPEQLQSDHPLARALGVSAARALAARYGREKIDVPRCVAAVRAARDECIRRDHAAGVSARQLAITYQLTERAIWKILARHAEPNPTGDLFD